MNAMKSDVSYSTPSSFSAPPVLVFGDCEASIKRGVRTIEAAGHRLADALALEHAGERLERQGSASALWVELAKDSGAQLDSVLQTVTRAVAEGRCGAIVSTPLALIDAVAARVDEPDVEIVVDADDAERAAALAVALARAAEPHRLYDASSDRNAERLRQLSDEVSRIASTLARLSTGPQPAARPNRAQTVDARARGVGGCRPDRHPSAPIAQPFFPRRHVCRSGLRHAPRPAPGGDRAAARAGLEPVHSRCGSRHDRLALAQDDD